MTSLNAPSPLERIAGSLPATASPTAISAAVGTPLAALLPVLANTLAAERQRKRVEANLQEINSALEKHEAQLANLTDQQYKFINEVILALLHTTNENKMRLLRDVVQNSLSATTLPDHQAVFLSRIVRDISAEEAQFLIDNFSYERIWLNENEPGERSKSTLAVKPSTLQGHIVLGLLSLGLVTAAESTWDDTGLLRFTSIAAKLITLLKNPTL